MYLQFIYICATFLPLGALFGRGRNRHKPSNTKMGKGRGIAQKLFEILGGNAGFRVFVNGVHLDENIHDLTVLCGLPLDLVGKLFAAHRVDQLHFVDNVFYLVGLKRSDEVDVQVFFVERVVFVQKLLHAVFADLAHAAGKRKVDLLRASRLGRQNDAYVLGISSDPLGGEPSVFQNRLDTVSNFDFFFFGHRSSLPFVRSVFNRSESILYSDSAISAIKREISLCDVTAGTAEPFPITSRR